MASILSEQWLHPDNYNFWSSEWGGQAFRLLDLIILIVLVRIVWKKVVFPHFECQVAECTSWGHPVHGTSFRACKPHHPHLEPEGHTVEEIHKAAKEGHSC